MSQPGSLGAIVPGSPADLGRRIAALEAQVKQMQTARSLEAAVIGAGGITVNGGKIVSGDFDGNLATGAAGTAGWGLGGPLGEAIFNRLVLRDGIIGDAALEHPAAFAAGHDDADAFALSHTVGTTVCTVTMPVPAGFSTALVLGISDMTVDAGSTAGAEATVITAINGVTTPFGNSVTLPVNDQRAVSNAFARVLTGLSGGNVTVITEVASNGVDIPAGGGTWANLAALAIFLR